MDYNRLFFIYIFVLSLCFAISPFIIHILYKYKVWKQRDELKIIENQMKKKPTPRMGGIIFILGVFFTTLLFNWDRQYTYVPTGVMMMGAALGATDDILQIFGRKRAVTTFTDGIKGIVKDSIFRKIINILLIPWRAYSSLFSGFNSSEGKELFPHERIFIYLIISVVVMWWFYFKLDLPGKNELWLPFGMSLTIGWLMIPFIIGIVFTTTVAVALTDGLDGLLASLAIVSFAAFGIISVLQGAYSLATFCVTMVGALMAYLYFNIKPARIWMGEVGSVALGTTLATVAVLLNRPILLIIIGLMYFIDFFSVLIQVYGVKIFHKRLLPIAPIHHWFEKLGWDESKIVVRAFIVAWVIAVIGVWLSRT
ncbi:MAG: phospho-N-acetylmuramoyl-pentapeptide-transferase [bacterium]